MILRRKHSEGILPRGRYSPEALRAEADRIERRTSKKKRPILYTFSHMVMAGIMLSFFAGALLGGYATIFKDEPVSVALDYIMELAKIVTLGYLIKAFGENIAKIILSFVFGGRLPDAKKDESAEG